MARFRFAVIDLGSNTFHLLISDLDSKSQSFTEVFRKRSFVYLSRDGVQQLSYKAIQRALASLKLLGSLCKAYEVDEIHVFGTAVFRQAKNSKIIQDAVQSYLDCNLRILSGEEEANYILEGISWTLSDKTKPYLIMDIGGGSVEYILVTDSDLLACSLNHGISVLRNNWNRKDPPTSDEIERLDSQLEGDFKELDIYKSNEPQILVGSSGPFEILESILGAPILAKKDVISLIEQILSKDLQQRLEIDKMPQSRADLSIESIALVNFILKRFTSINSIRISPYGIKEGIIRERLNLG